MHNGLEVRNELRRVQCPLHFMGRRHCALLQEVNDGPGDHTEKNQQTEQGRVFAAHVSPGFAFGETCRNSKGIVFGQLSALGDRQFWPFTFVDLAVRRQPIRADLQQQRGLATDQAQDVAQVITVQGRQHAFLAFAEAIHQQRRIGRHRIAVHEP
ncbi:hypothetical protein D3C81_1672760 [compost metagenome]